MLSWTASTLHEPSLPFYRGCPTCTCNLRLYFNPLFVKRQQAFPAHEQNCNKITDLLQYRTPLCRKRRKTLDRTLQRCYNEENAE